MDFRNQWRRIAEPVNLRDEPVNLRDVAPHDRNAPAEDDLARRLQIFSRRISANYLNELLTRCA